MHQRAGRGIVLTPEGKALARLRDLEKTGFAEVAQPAVQPALDGRHGELEQ